MKKIKNIIKILPIIWFANQAIAAGFQSSQTSVADLGYAYAGSASSIEDTSVVYNNPAGMVFRDQNSAQASLYYLDNNLKFTNDGSTKDNQAGGGLMSGAKEANGGTKIILPNLYIHKKYDNFDLGLSVNVPFGNSTKYDKNWVGRYYAVKSELKVPNINLAIAKKITDKLSIGGGINYQKANIVLTNSIDYDTISKKSHHALSASDGSVHAKADDAAIGYNLGLMYKISDDSNIGVAYRSETKFNLSGKANFTEPSDINAAVSTGLAALKQLQDTNVKADLVIPAQLSVGFNTKLNPKTTLYLNTSWTDWSVMKKLDIDFASKQSNSTSTLNWQDTYKVAAGIGYQYSEKLKLRFGIASDESAAKNDKIRSPSSPGGQLNWISAGAGYHYNKDLQMDFAIAHVKVQDSGSDAIDITNLYHLIGKYNNSSSTIIGAQVVWKF